MPNHDSHHDSMATVIERFVAELQRRKVVRVAIVYGAFAWLLLQFSDIIIDAFSAPDWVMRVLVLFLILALPATLILAWLFDITPTGIKLTADNQLQDEDLLPSILLITSSNDPAHEDSDSLCQQLSSKLSEIISAYNGEVAGMHAGHCVVQFKDATLAVTCGLAILRLLEGSERPVSLSIATGHYHAGTLASQAINIAESIKMPLNGSQQLVISTPVYEHEINASNNPLLKFFKARECQVNGHELHAFEVKADAIKHPAVLWRIKDAKKSAGSEQTVFSKHRILLASILTLVVAFSWLYLGYQNTGTTLVRSIAIMPFRSLDESAESRAISLGLHEDLQDRMRQLSGVKITSSRSARAMATRDLAVPELGEKLNVNYLVEGSVMRVEEEYRVSINLTETGSGQIIWSDRYQTDRNDLYSVQEDVIKQLATKLAVTTETIQDTVQLSNKDYGLYLQAIGSLELPDIQFKLAKTESEFEELLLRYPNYAPAQAGLCRVYLLRFGASKSSADFQKAESFCELAEHSSSDNINILRSLAQMNIARSNWEKAQTYVDKGLLIDAENLDLLLDSANISIQMGQLEMAEEILLQAIRIEPGYWRSYNQLGFVYLQLNRLDDSIVEFKKAAVLMPTEADIHNRLGVVYFNLGNFSQAAEEFVQSIALNPNYIAYTNAGTLYYFAGDYDKAREYNLIATQLQPKNYLLWRNLADSESAIPGEYRSAMSHYQLVSTMAEELLEVTPNDTQALSSMAWALAQTDQSEAALKYIQQALSLAPKNPDVLYDASITYTRLGDGPSALDCIQRAIDAGYPAAVIAATPGLNALYPGTGPAINEESS